MFNDVTIAKPNFSIGELAEALLFYKKVRIVGHSTAILNVANKIGLDNLSTLVEIGLLEIRHDHSIPAIVNTGADLFPYFMSFISLHGVNKDHPLKTPEDHFIYASKKINGTRAWTSKNIRALTDLVIERPAPNAVRLTLADIENPTFLSESIKAVVEAIAPGFNLPKGFYAQVKFGPDRKFWINTNFDLDLFDEYRRSQGAKSEDKTDLSHILIHFLDANRELVFSGDANTDLWLNGPQSAFTKKKLSDMSKSRLNSAAEIDLFRETIFQIPDIASAIDSGDREISEIIPLVTGQSSVNFKDWLSHKRDIHETIKEYSQSLSGKSKLTESVGFKSIKLVAFALAGHAIGGIADQAATGTVLAAAASPATDVAFATAEELISSKLRLGWRPDQWVREVKSTFSTT